MFNLIPQKILLDLAIVCVNITFNYRHNWYVPRDHQCNACEAYMYHKNSIVVKALQMEGCRDAGMAQGWEHSPPTNLARVQFPDLASNVGWACWFSTLHGEVFPSPQKPKFALVVLTVNFSYSVPNKCSSARTTRHLDEVSFLSSTFNDMLHLKSLKVEVINFAPWKLQIRQQFPKINIIIPKQRGLCNIKLHRDLHRRENIVLIWP